MVAGEHQQIAHEIVREGFQVSCWSYRGFVVISACPLRSRQSSEDSLPVLPSRSRIVVWGDGSGPIRDRVRNPTPRARFGAWLRRVPFPSRDAQLEALTAELLAAIGEAPGGREWAERGGDAFVPRSPIRLPGQRPIDLEQGRTYWAAAFVALVVALALAFAAAFALLRDAGATDATGVPTQPVQISEPADLTGSSTGAAGPAGDAAAEAGDPAPAVAIDDAPSAANVVLVPAASEATTAEPDIVVEPSSAAAAVTYVVQTGDALMLIADRHAVELFELLAANALDGDGLIYPGQLLRIPDA